MVDIENLKKLEVVAGFAEADATKIKVGQPALVTLAALTSTTVTGKVTAVSPTSTVTSNVVTYDVTIRLVNPPATVRDGMTADVSVIVANKANVLRASERRDHHDRTPLDRHRARERQADGHDRDHRASSERRRRRS